MYNYVFLNSFLSGCEGLKFDLNLPLCLVETDVIGHVIDR